MSKMIKVLSEEMEGALTDLKIKRDTVMASLSPTTVFYKRLTSNNDLKKAYDKGKLNYIEQEHIEVCQLETSNENTIHCLPLYAVKKEKLNETKFRIVFDASSYDPGMPSLNDTLEVQIFYLKLLGAFSDSELMSLQSRVTRSKLFYS
ncbi:integrase catalytic domain-containing protein [Trichonephila inaurata madagascariensis]|uniref:Integrase catalytic domain-containing protein n=1 Tax=Trichonephila inaurata madagascariensis TaxID=2747483 RepID=A0A8X6WRR1_9ARAC|nr:integrase catalytic domain-containing protein [Trichonephila inaurata madagascariensis]